MHEPQRKHLENDRRLTEDEHIIDPRPRPDYQVDAYQQREQDRDEKDTVYKQERIPSRNRRTRMGLETCVE